MRALLRSLTSRSPSGRKASPHGTRRPVTSVGLADRSGMPGPGPGLAGSDAGGAGLSAAFVGFGPVSSELEQPPTMRTPSVNAANRRITPPTMPEPGHANHYETGATSQASFGVRSTRVAATARPSAVSPQAQASRTWLPTITNATK